MKFALRVSALGHQRWASVHKTHKIYADIRRVSACIFFEVHELLTHRKALTTEVLRPMKTCISSVVELALPFRVVDPTGGPIARRGWRAVLRYFDFEPGPNLSAELFIGGAISQVHAGTLWVA